MLSNIQHCKRAVNPHGGIVFLMDEMRLRGIPAVIDTHFGARPKQATYSFSDILLCWVYSTLCGNTSLESTKKVKVAFSEIPDHKHPSPDRIGDIFKSWATPNVIYDYENSSDDDKKHYFNINAPLNNLMLDIAMKLEMINKNDYYMLDYDNTIIECEKQHDEACAITYDKSKRGYSPSVSFIGNIPVYIEGRSGMTPVTYRIEESVARSLNMLEQREIKIKMFRSDAGGYVKELTSMLDSRNIDFLIRFSHNERVYRHVKDLEEWQDVEINNKKCQLISTNYDFGKRKYRVVIKREFIRDKKFINQYTGDKYSYWSIITNNHFLSDKEIVLLYNERGKTELVFKDLKGDWNWDKLPFSYLNYNISYMCISAIGSIMYRYVLNKYSDRLPFVKDTYRLTNFIYHFINVALEWALINEIKVPLICHDGRNRDYSPLYNRPPCLPSA